MHSIMNIFTKEKTISSLEVAEMMGISHKELLRKLNGSTDRKGICSILAENQMEPSNYFVPSTYTDGSGKENPCYKITKMGCDFLANKFTGEKGILFTAKYVKRFSEMEEQLKPKSSAEMLLIYAQQFYEQEQRLNSIEHNVKQLEAKITTHDENYYTIAGYASLRGIKVDVNRANMYGRKASKLSKEYGYEVSKTQDPRFGTVNMYHVDILKDIFD